MLKFHLLCLLSFITFVACGSLPDYSLPAYISPNDRLKLKHVFENAWKFEDLGDLHYAIASYRVFNDKLPVQEKDICDFVKKQAFASSSLEVLYHATSIVKEVPACASNQFSNDVGTKILQASQKDVTLMEELYYIVSILTNLKSDPTDVSFISKSLKSILKSNETVFNLGYAFHVSTILPKKEIENLFVKIDGVISQADEVDGRYYQFEGGLTVTALVIDGIYKIAEKLKKTPPFTNVQLTKFVNYLTSRTTSSRPKAVYRLLHVLKTLSENNFHTFVSVGPFAEPEISKSQSTVAIRVSDVFGNPVYKSDASPLTVTLVSVSKDGTAANTVTTNKLFAASTEKTKYTLNSNDLNLAPDHYKFIVSVAAPKGKSDKGALIALNNVVEFKVITTIQIENFQIGIHNTEDSSSPSLNKLDYPKKSEPLVVDSHQRLVIKFSVKDANYGKLSKIQQAVVKVINKKSKLEATIVCHSDSNRNFKLNLDPSSFGDVLNFISDDYEVVVIVADALISPSIKWTVADVKIRFSQDAITERNLDVVNYYLPKPEIKHLFREPEKRPPAVVSNVFTAFVLAPLFILFILWLKLGVNLKNFPFTLSSIGFHLGLGGIFALFGVFWLQLNMFQTIKYLLILGTVTFLSGNKMLSAIASKSKK